MIRRIALLVVVACAAIANAQTTTQITGLFKDLAQNVVQSGKVTFTLKPGADALIAGLARFNGQTITCTINAQTVATSQAVRSSNSVTITFAGGHTFVANDVITVASMTDSSFNGTFTIGSVTSTTITYPQTASNSTSGGGTVQALRQNPGPGQCQVTQNTALQPSGTYYNACIWPSNVKSSCFNFFATTSTLDLSTVIPTPQTAASQGGLVDTFSNQTIGGLKNFSLGATFNYSTLLSGIAAFNGFVGFGTNNPVFPVDVGGGIGLLNNNCQAGVSGHMQVCADSSGNASVTEGTGSVQNLVELTKTQSISNKTCTVCALVSPTTTGTDNGAENLQNKNLATASNGNTVSLLYSAGVQSALTGNSAYQTVPNFTYTLPANTVGAGKGLRITIAYQHTTGTGSVSYQLQIGGVAVETYATTSTNANDYVQYWIMNRPNTQATQDIVRPDFVNNAAGNATLLARTFNFANSNTITFNFNAANTEALTGYLFMIELIQ